MINDEELDTFYYLYRHIRLDTNVPFYIGIGTYKSTSKYKNKYNRAFTHNKRNQYWKNVYIFKYATDTTPIEEFKKI